MLESRQLHCPCFMKKNYKWKLMKSDHETECEQMVFVADLLKFIQATLLIIIKAHGFHLARCILAVQEQSTFRLLKYLQLWCSGRVLGKN